MPRTAAEIETVFQILDKYNRNLRSIFKEAEDTITISAGASLGRSRLFAEVILGIIADKNGLPDRLRGEKFHGAIIRLYDLGCFPEEIKKLFDFIKEGGNRGTHRYLAGQDREAPEVLANALELAFWFSRLGEKKHQSTFKEDQATPANKSTFHDAVTATPPTSKSTSKPIGTSREPSPPQASPRKQDIVKKDSFGFEFRWIAVLAIIVGALLWRFVPFDEPVRSVEFESTTPQGKTMPRQPTERSQADKVRCILGGGEEVSLTRKECLDRIGIVFTPEKWR